MAKRSHEEASADYIALSEPVKVKKAKKSKPTTEGSTISDVPVKTSKEARKELRAERKEKKADIAKANGKRSKEKKEQEAAEAGLDLGSIKTAEKEEKRLKQERKEAKKAKKRAAKALAADGAVNTSDDTLEETKVDGSSTHTPSKPNTSNGVSINGGGLSQSEIDDFLKTKQITIEEPGQTKPTVQPITKFAQLPSGVSLPQQFASFTAPTPIQSAAWPYLFAGRDVVGVAETGSGKTMAFGLPCIKHIVELEKKQRKGIRAVIVSPTRELASQIEEQMVKLAEPAGLKVVCVYGGVPKPPQQAALKTAHIVVATPGRLNDLINEGSANVSTANYVVLDEADRMLDKGFEEDIKKIIGATQPLHSRQTLMFTATWPQSIRDLAATFMREPVRILIGDNTTGELRANVRITQTVEVMEGFRKEGRLNELLREHQSGKKSGDRILVFCLYKKEATRIEQFISRKGFKVAGIHGDLSQGQREASLASFKAGDVPILVATDVAARGLDIPDVRLVINVTFPLTAEDYVHRIGRTGRAGQDGKAVTFFTDHDKALAGALVNVLKAAKQNVPEDLLKFGTAVKKKGHDAYGAFTKDIDSSVKATKITFDD